jgi:hypothetical protein
MRAKKAKALRKLSKAKSNAFSIVNKYTDVERKQALKVDLHRDGLNSKGELQPNTIIHSSTIILDQCVRRTTKRLKNLMKDGKLRITNNHFFIKREG